MKNFFSFFYLHGKHNLKQSIEKAGFSTNEVTDVILTHLHFDHCGGAVNKGNNFELAFPNAKYWTNKEHWEWANNPNQREKASFS